MAVNHSVEAMAASESSGKTQMYIILAVILCVSVLASKLWSSGTPDPREPSLIHPKIPILGHALGMMMQQVEYLSNLSNNLQLPIFRINIFGGQLYIINSPELVQAVFRQSKAFTFDVIATSGTKRLVSMTDRQMKILANPIPGMEGVEYPLSNLILKAMHSVLAPGPNAPILVMNARALNRFAQFLNPIGKEGIAVDMYSWICETFTVATSVGIYGPDSPFENDRTLVKSLIDFEDSIMLLMLDVKPSLIASKGHRGREAIKAAFQRYYRDGGDSKTTGLCTVRRRTLCDGGFDLDDVASFDIAVLLAASMNSNPAIFWLVSYIFSDPELLAEIRQEVTSAVSIKDKEASIDISQLLKACPLITSCLQEMLRLTDATVGSRVATEDAMLNDTYLVRKGGFIQMLCGPMHTSTSIWGADSHLFNPRRFLKSTQDNLSKESRKTQKNGYIPFGGGTSLCPGRHFVTMEILGAVATLVVGYEITMQDGSQLQMPKMKKQAFAVQVKHVDGDLGIKIKRREGWEGIEWAYDVGAGELAGADDMTFNN